MCQCLSSGVGGMVGVACDVGSMVGGICQADPEDHCCNLCIASWVVGSGCVVLMWVVLARCMLGWVGFMLRLVLMLRLWWLRCVRAAELTLQQVLLLVGVASPSGGGARPIYHNKLKHIHAGQDFEFLQDNCTMPSVPLTWKANDKSAPWHTRAVS